MAYQWDAISIRDRITDRLRAKINFADILYYSANLRLIDSFAEELADLANYDEYLTREATWKLARNRSSLLASQAVHQYAAHRKNGASGTIRVAVSEDIGSSDWVETTEYNANDIVYYEDVLYVASQTTTGDQPDESPTYWDLLDISPTVAVSIPKWTVFSDETGDYKFTSYSTESLNPGENFVDVDVVQGTPQTYTVTATGISNEEFLLEVADIENNRFELYVNSVLWTKVDSLLEYTATDTVYTIENLIDFSGLYLKFGNDSYGKKLSNGDIVEFYYVSTDGSDGNVTSAGVISTIDSTLYDANGDTVTAYCRNMDTLSGGEDEEDIESIRLNAPKIFQTGDRASSSSDYTAIIDRDFSFVLKSIVWGAYEVNIDAGNDPWTFIDSEENVVHVAAISQSEENLTTEQKELISEGLNEYKAPTDIVTFEDVRFLNLAFKVVAYVSDTSYTLSSVTNGIRTALAADYSVSALDLNENIYFSDYQSLIDDVDGVHHHTTYAEIFYDYAFTDDSYTATLALPSNYIRTSSVSIYVQDTVGGQTSWTKIAEDNGLGGWTAETGYTISSSSSINYTSGVGVIVVESGLSETFTNYTIRVFYRLTSDDLLLYERSDIFKYSSLQSEVTASYIR